MITLTGFEKHCKRCPKPTRIPEAVCYNGVQSTNLVTKVELFNQFFRTVYSAPSTESNHIFTDVVNPSLLSNIKTTAHEVKEILQKLDISKATGADNVPARILTELALKNYLLP